MPPLDEAERSFGELLGDHLNSGTRPPGCSRQGRAWTRVEFADKLGISDRQVRKYLGNDSLPNEIETIESALFGLDQAHARPARLRLRQALSRAKQTGPRNFRIGLEHAHQTPNDTERQLESIKARWLDFARTAWSAVGRPTGLDPSSIAIDPTTYDRRYYEYMEERFSELWLGIYGCVEPKHGTLVRREGAAFQAAWQRNFAWPTIWKQLIPLFVYGGALRVSNNVLVQLGANYCVAQAIPSMVIDRMLDTPVEDRAKPDDAAFCMLAYTKGLSGIRGLRLPFSNQLEECFLRHTRLMYETMMQEHAERFVPPREAPSDLIGRYLTSQNRLLSSIFFGVLPEWAYIAAGKQMPPTISETLHALRRVRQLNDEIVDVQDDIVDGLVTLPWLYALEEDRSLHGLIGKLWRQPQNPQALAACNVRLQRTHALQRASTQSEELLLRSMEATMTCFHAREAFELTLLHNVRWAMLARLRNSEFRDVRPPREPSIPSARSVTSPSLVTPVAGAGAVVTDGRRSVLMSLVLKRGMLRWELPAGVAKDGESMEQTAWRETLEETGLKIVVGGTTALCWHYSMELAKGWMGIFF
ncbi:MAG: NUDIX domain-containing protein [Fimbriimonadaceae bacterium]